MNTNGNMKKMMLVLAISFLMAGTSFSTPRLAVDDMARDDANARDVTPSHIESWSASSLANPLILFQECVLADLVVDSHGNTYVTGTFKDEIRFGNNTLSNSDYAVFVSKLNRHGIWEWAYQSFGDEARSHGITLDESEQNLYVVGSFFFDNWFGQFGQNHVNSSTELQMFVAKMTLDGDFKYVKTPISGNSSAEAVIASSGGGAYITGVHRSQLNLINVNSLPADEDDAFVISMDADGSWLWATSTSCGTGTTSRQSQYCGNENASSLTLGPDGDLHVLGVMDIDTIFGEDSTDPELPLAGGTDVFIWSINPTDGSSTGVFGTTGEGNESSAEIASLGENLIISGNFFGQMFLDGINVSSITLGSFMLSAGFVGSYSVMEDPPSWNWVRTVGGTTDSGPTSGRFTLVDFLSLPWTPPWELTDVVIGPDGSIHVAGEYRAETQLDSLTLPSTDVIWVDAFVAQLSSDGDWQNVMSVGGMGPDGMTRIDVTNSEVRVGFDSHLSNVTFANNIHYPLNRSVVVGSFQWDRDADGVADALDNCLETSNTNQTNWDGDGNGDACDGDDDNDGIDDIDDSCPFIHRGANDADGDGCPDGILVGCMDPAANNFTNLANVNSTTCEYGDDPTPEPELSCEDDCPIVDDDGDGVANVTDICPNTPSGSYVNSTGCREDPPILGCTNPDAANYDEDAEKDDGSCVYSPEPPAGNDTTTLGDFTDCDLASQEDCEEEAIVVGSVGVGLIGGGIIRNILRPGTGKGGGKPNLHLGKAKDAYDGAKFIADKTKGKKTSGGSDHYLKPGVERQQAMSTSADTALDDYVED